MPGKRGNRKSEVLVRYLSDYPARLIGTYALEGFIVDRQFGLHFSIFLSGQGEMSIFPPIVFVLVCPAPNSLWLLESH